MHVAAIRAAGGERFFPTAKPRYSTSLKALKTVARQLFGDETEKFGEEGSRAWVTVEERGSGW
jgi:hypothetical protein